jgi:hypothetical protein
METMLFVRSVQRLYQESALSLHKDYDRKGSVAKKNERKQDSDRKPQEAWRQDKLIGGKPPIVK